MRRGKRRPHFSKKNEVWAQRDSHFQGDDETVYPFDLVGTENSNLRKWRVVVVITEMFFTQKEASHEADNEVGWEGQK